MNAEFDAIVIGSGIGGLTTASLLSQLGHKRVLLLERHFKLGGFSQTFHRAGYTFDPGLHYVGDMQPGSQARRFMDLVTAAGVDWSPMASPFDSFVYPDLRIDQPDDPAAFQALLIDRFPAEAPGIVTYFQDIGRASAWFSGQASLPLLVPGGHALQRVVPGRALALQTTASYLDRHFTDARLKAVLASQWGDYGLPPARSAFVMHALVVQSYLHGASYPIGGAGQIAEHVAAVVRAGGGEVLINHQVNEIIVQNGRACGVRATTGHGQHRTEVEFRAPLVVSDAGAQTTVERLLPAGCGDRERALVASLAATTPTSMVMLYLGLSASPERLGVHGENYWLYSGLDHEAAYANTAELLNGQITGCYVSFPSMRDPNAPGHTAQIITWANPDDFAAWRDQPWHRRSAAYTELKERITDGLLDFVETRLPGFRELVAFRELATPLSVETFTGHEHGAIYGLPATPARFAGPALGPKTSVPGLLLTGCDVGTLGVTGAMMGGVFAAATALGPLGLPRIAAAAARLVLRTPPTIDYQVIKSRSPAHQS